MKEMKLCLVIFFHKNYNVFIFSIGTNDDEDIEMCKCYTIICSFILFNLSTRGCFSYKNSFIKHESSLPSQKGMRGIPIGFWEKSNFFGLIGSLKGA